MVHSIYRALLLLSFGLISRAFTLGFSDSQQCGNVKVTWTRPADSVEQFQFPFYLYILPFNNTATIRQIPNWNTTTSSGSTVLDFPLSASSPYILGVVDSQGKGVGASSTVLVAQNSTNTSCLPPQSQQPSQFQATPTVEPSECPSVLLSFNPPSDPPRTLLFSPGERPRNIRHITTDFKTGFIRISELTSLSRVVIVYQENGTSQAVTSSLLTVGGTDSVKCESTLTSVVKSSRPPALEGGSVIAYAFAAVVLTGLITTLCLYLYNLRIMRRTPCPPPKDYLMLSPRSTIASRRMSSRRLSQRDMDLEIACGIPLPPSTISLISPSSMSKNKSVVSIVIPEPPYTTPVSPQHSISNLNHTEETVRPIVPDQPGQSSETSSVPVVQSPIHRSNPSLIAYSDTTKHIKRHSDVSTYIHSTRPSTFTSDTRGSAILSLNSEPIPPRFTPRPDSPTLPDVSLTSPFHFEFNAARLSKGSSKKSEKRSLYTKIQDVKEDSEDGADALKRRRARSLTRSRGNGSHQSKKKARSVPR